MTGTRNMEEKIFIPEKIKAHTGGRRYSTDTLGKSGASVYIYDDMVLKTEKYSPGFDIQIKLYEWLGGKLPVPELIEWDIADGMSYMLTSRISGHNGCDKDMLDHPETLTELLAEGLKMLWDTDITGCPRENTYDVMLSQMKERIDSAPASLEGICRENGFSDAYELFGYLDSHRPGYDPVFSHGDFCLPNIFFDNNTVSGFIDIGNAGISDRYSDISDCLRSLRRNTDGTFGKVIDGFDPDMLFEKLGISPDREKIRFFDLIESVFF